MKINVREVDGCVVVSLDSSVLQEHIPMLKSRLEALVEEGKTAIVIDMSNTGYLSSMGLSTILKAKGRAMECGGDLKLACVNQLIAHLLDITNLSRKLETFDSVGKALEALGGGNSDASKES